MRNFALTVATLTAVALTGCGVSPSSSVIAKRNAAMSAASLVDEGPIVFDKDVVYKLIEVLGIGDTYNAALQAHGIKTVKQLLLAGATPTARKNVARDAGISQKLILTWVNYADLMRVTGCGPEYARLLERAGVDTVMELSKRNSIKLVDALKKANDLGGGKVCVHRLPSDVTTSKWVENANQFQRLVTY